MSSTKKLPVACLLGLVFANRYHDIICFHSLFRDGLVVSRVPTIPLATEKRTKNRTWTHLKCCPTCPCSRTDQVHTSTGKWRNQKNYSDFKLSIKDKNITNYFTWNQFTLIMRFENFQLVTIKARYIAELFHSFQFWFLESALQT